MRVFLAACCALLAACSANFDDEIAAAPGGHILLDQNNPPPLSVAQTRLIDLGYIPVQPETAASIDAIPGSLAPGRPPVMQAVSAAALAPSEDIAAAIENNEVAYVQVLLDQMGYAPGPIDGILGPLTRAAIESFQRRQQLPARTDLDIVTAQLEAARLVPEAQQLLTELGYVPGPIDGIPGPLTIAALTAFQSRAGLAPSGTVNEESLVALRGVASIREIQIRLTGLGYAPGPADGILGPRTRKAILFFERDRNLPPVGWSPAVVRERLREAPYIEETQRLLAVLGYNAGPANGRDSQRTQAAIRAYQADSNLPVTGRASADLLFSIQVQAQNVLTPASGPSANGTSVVAPNPMFARLLPLAEGGAPSAQHLVAGLYMRGQGVHPSLESAIDWYEEAANQGYTPSQFRLGLLYAFGIGTDVDMVAAKLWFSQAASGGHPGAAHALAMLGNGLDPEDYPSIP